jgi:hypothetical protein
MRAVNDVGALVTGAEQAAARGDNASAERLLRQALSLQEANLGSQHPDVANTLNNLAILSEMNGKLIDAEACYRRAYAIAVATLPPTDPLVTTSRENLEEFCAAHGVTLKRPPAPGAASALTAPPVASSAPPPKPAPPPKVAAPPSPGPARKPAAAPPKATLPPRAAAPSSLDDFAIDPTESATLRAPVALAAVHTPSRTPGIAATVAIVALLIAAVWYLLNSNRPADRTTSAQPAETSSPSSAAPSPASSAPPSQPASEGEPLATDTTATTPPAAPAPETVATIPPPPAPVAAAPEQPETTPVASSVDVVSAELCRSLTTSGAWRCTPATGTMTPGPMVFYTKVASERDTTIEHRWYREGRLHQNVPLRIRPNPSGFRTYSRTTITPERAGRWKVELRTRDGQVLEEKTFTVQP